MGRAEFEENSFRGILDKSKTVDETIIESGGTVSRLFVYTDQEFSAVLAELYRSRNRVQEKLASARRARSECAKRIENCKGNYDRSEEGDEQEKAERAAHNAQVDSEIARLQQSSGEVENAISALEQVLEAFNQMEQKLSSARSAFDGERARNNAEMQRSLSYGERFYHAVENAHAKATEIINFQEKSLPAKWHGDIYKINRAGHEGKRNFKSPVRGFFDVAPDEVVSAWGDHDESGPTEYVIPETKSADEFFARLAEMGENVSAIKIPSYDFHKIGGKATLQELERRGFEVKKTDGSMIGNDGFITLEKKK